MPSCTQLEHKTGRPPGPGGRGDSDDLVLRLYMLGAREAWGIEPRAWVTHSM